MEELDVIVVGAGLSGLIAATRYLQANPESNLTVLEHDYCLGGVWSKRRIYPSFWTQWVHGIAEFADLPMERPPDEDCANDLFKARYTCKYLEDYADHIKIAGRSLRDRIQFNIDVESVEKRGDRWHLACTGPDGKGDVKTLSATYLMMANGHASIPRLPDLPGQHLFKGIILHSIDFGQSSVISDPLVEHIAVLGAGKSSADMVYEAAKAGKTVSWIIRRTGDGSTGPGFFAPFDLPSPGYRNPAYMAQTRVMSKRGDSKSFEKLQYETYLFWQNGVGGALHHADFWDIVAQNVTIHRARVKKLLPTELYLDYENGTHFPCDTILCGTGWLRGLSMFSASLRQDLGLPFPKGLEAPENAQRWATLVSKADKHILSRFRILRSPPPHPFVPKSHTPYRLFRGMAPLNDRSILVINHITVGNKMFGAEAQAMWALAYFAEDITLPSIQEREEDIATWIAWCRRRYLTNGQLGNFAAFGGVGYVDLLMEDMQVTKHKGKGCWGDLMKTVVPADLGRGWVEYLGRRRRGSGKEVAE